MIRRICYYELVGAGCTSLAALLFVVWKNYHCLFFITLIVTSKICLRGSTSNLNFSYLRTDTHHCRAQDKASYLVCLAPWLYLKFFSLKRHGPSCRGFNTRKIGTSTLKFSQSVILGKLKSSDLLLFIYKITWYMVWKNAHIFSFLWLLSL